MNRTILKIGLFIFSIVFLLPPTKTDLFLPFVNEWSTMDTIGFVFNISSDAEINYPRWASLLFIITILTLFISYLVGQRKNKERSKKSELLNEIEFLKKEEELGLLNEANKSKLDELVELYKKYDEQVMQTNEQVVHNNAWIENSVNQNVQMPSWKSTIFITLGLFIALIIIAFISRLI